MNRWLVPAQVDETGEPAPQTHESASADDSGAYTTYELLDLDEALTRDAFRSSVLSWLVSRNLLIGTIDECAQILEHLSKVRCMPNGSISPDSLDSAVIGLCERVARCPGVRAWLETLEPAVPSSPLVLPRLSRRTPFPKLRAAIESAVAQASAHLLVAARETPLIQDQMAAGAITGHLVRLYKLHDTTCFLIDGGRPEMALILWRSLVDTAISLGDILMGGLGGRERVQRFMARPEEQDPPQAADRPDALGAGERGVASDRAGRAVAYAESAMARARGQRRRNIRFDAQCSEFTLAMYEEFYQPLSTNVHGGWSDLTTFHLFDAGMAYVPEFTYAAGGTGWKIAPTLVAVEAASWYCMWGTPESELSHRLHELDVWLLRALAYSDRFEADERHTKHLAAAEAILRRAKPSS
jgi:hypothetical protein